MPNPISFTAQRVDEALIEYLYKAQPTTLSIMNDPGAAIALASEFPNTRIYHRHIPAKDWDNDPHKKYSPQAFWDQAAAVFKGTAARISVMNETSLTEESARWLADVAELLVKNGQGGLLFNAGVGRPRSERLGLAMPFMEMIYTEDKIDLGLHEYWPHHWKTGLGFYVGRFLDWLELFAFRDGSIVFSEWTFDVIHGQGGPYQSIGVSQAEAFNQMTECWSEVYAPHPEILGVQAYLWGFTDPEWQPYDFSTSTDLHRNLINWQPPGRPDHTPDPIFTLYGRYVVGGLAGRLNTRNAPGGQVVGSVVNGDVILLTGNTARELLGGVDYVWHEVETGKSPRVWIAQVDGLTLTKYNPPKQIDIEAVLSEVEYIRKQVDTAAANITKLLQ